MAKLTVKGLDKLEKKLRKSATMKQVKDCVRKHGSQLQTEMQENADFKGHYEGNKFKIPTGRTKGSIVLEMKDGGFTAEVGPETEYSPYLEYGTRFMASQPFVGPALNTQKEKFKRDLNKLVR